VVDLAMRGKQKVVHPFQEDSLSATRAPAESVVLPPTTNALPSTELPCSLPDFLENIEAQMIRRALLQTNNNRTQAAELLGISFRQLRYQIQKLNIQE